MDKLGLRELLRYGYTGLLCALVVVMIDGAYTKQLVLDLGNVLSPLVMLAIGTFVYLVFKTLVGDLFLWRLIDWAHVKIEDMCGRTGTVTRCKVRYLEQKYEIPHGQGSAAFALIRDIILKDVIRERFHVQHSEGYLLFVTAFVCGAVSLLGYTELLPTAISSKMSASLAVAALGAGFCHDIILCRAERDAISAIPEEEIKKVLQDSGFIENKTSTTQNQESIGLILTDPAIIKQTAPLEDARQ